MPLGLRKEHIAIQPRGITYLILFVALLALAYAAIHANVKQAVVVTLFPTCVFIFLAGMQYPMFGFLIYCTTTFYFHAICRYSGIEYGVSGLLDISLYVCLLSLIVNAASGSTNFKVEWKNACNYYSVGQLLWLVFISFELLFPYSNFNGDFATVRAMYITSPLPFLICGLLLDSPRKLRIALVLIGFFTLTAMGKAYWQKYHGWDAAEVRSLLGGGWHTHLLRDGTVRYFSFFSDAGNFGGTMGILCSAFSIAGFVIRRFWLRLICVGSAIAAGVGIFLSGTRGAMVIPFVAMVVYVLLSKNVKAIVTTLIMGAAIFSFFYFTDIGNDNKFIHRARTAFRPDEDASFNVRLGNQKRFAYYLADKPFGVGIGGHVVDTQQLMDLEEEYIPTDSFLVEIWVQHGIVGLVVYCLYIGIVFLRGCYLLLFEVRHPRLRQLLAGMLGATCGLFVNGYVARTWGFVPSTLIVIIFLSFVMNGAYIDKQLSADEDI